MKKNQFRLFIVAAVAATSNLLLSTIANAIMLNGNVTQSAVPAQTALSASIEANASNLNATNVRAQILPGTWECDTRVVASSAPGVVLGAAVRCAVRYQCAADGNLLELQEESGWAPSLAAVVRLNTEVMTVTHESVSSSRAGQINAKSLDRMKLVSPNTMVGESVVTQYVNGVFAGQYKTASVMHKVG
jgi:hypothetical protein